MGPMMLFLGNRGQVLDHYCERILTQNFDPKYCLQEALPLLLLDSKFHSMQTAYAYLHGNIYWNKMSLPTSADIYLYEGLRESYDTPR